MTQARCEQCGEPVRPGALFCSKCGVDVSSVMPALEDTVPITAVGGEPIAPVRTTMRQALRDATLGEYEIMNELGRGGMATVFLAHDIALDRKVAIKVMAPHMLEGEGMAERFKLEARTAAQLSHPHIIPIYAVKETADTLFFVMKYIEGRALDDILKKSGQLPIPMVRDILIKVGNALGYAHRRDVVHRDIKPGNVMIDDEGTPIVTDFGIAKVAATSGLTITGTTIGTPSYMSPEQCEAKEVTGASDQYSLGIVAFQMLTGTLPFEGDSAVSTMYKQCHDPLPPLRDFRPDCPQELVDAVSRMLEKKPSDRWPTMEAAVQRLATDTGGSLAAARSQLIAAARQSGDAELAARLSDPSLSKTEPVEPTTDPRRASRPTPSVDRRKVAAAGVALLLGAAALGVLRPWENAPPAGESMGPEAANGAPTTGGAEDTPPAVGGPDGPSNGAGGETAPTDGEGGGTVAGDATQPGAEPAGAQPDTPDDPAGGAEAGGGTPAGTPSSGPAQRQYVVAAVAVSGARGPMEPGDAVSLTADAVDASNAAIPASVIDRCEEHGWTRCGVAWASDDPGVARVSAGSVTAVAPGRATISATIAGVTGSIEVEVRPASVASLVIEPDALTVEQGGTGALGARTLSRDGSVLTGRSLTWTSSDPSVATVSDGAVRGVAPGSATITVSAEGARASVAVDVLPDARTAAEELIEAYGRAFESGDIDQVRALIPTLSADFASGLERAFGFMRQIRTDFVIRDFQAAGSRATAVVGGTYEFVDEDAGRQNLRLEPPLTFVLERTGSGWRIADIVAQR